MAYKVPDLLRETDNYRYGPWTIWAFRHIPLIQRLHRLSLFLEVRKLET